MYRKAGKQRLYGLSQDKLKLRNPFKDDQDQLEVLPKDESGREQYLKPFGELKIFKAINEQCPSAIERLKWITLVNMALVTCLRKGVLLNLKWRDVEWGNQWIKVSKSYWKRGKRAPEYVPLTKKLFQLLKQYY